MTVDADDQLLNSVEIDGKRVSPDGYTVAHGSTILTFNKDITEALAEGEHTVVAYYVNGKAGTKLTVKPLEETTEPTETEQPTDETKPADDPAKQEETTKPEETKPEETKPEETKPEEVKQEESTKPAEKPEETKQEETKPEESKAEEAKPEESKAEETKPEETKKEETKTETTGTTTEGGKDVPKTGDTTSVIGSLVALLGSGSGLGGILVFSKKRRR